METRLSLLSSISYTVSYKAKKPNADIMLEGEGDWIVLIRDAEAFRTIPRNKNKTWSICIHDKSMIDTKEGTGAKVYFILLYCHTILTMCCRRRRSLTPQAKLNHRHHQPLMQLCLLRFRRSTTAMRVRLRAMFL